MRSPCGPWSFKKPPASPPRVPPLVAGADPPTTHRALLAEYISCIVDCEFAPGDRSLAALPLYHSAQMHVFIMPLMLVGATSVLIQAPVPEGCLALIEEHRITSFFAPPASAGRPVINGETRVVDAEMRDMPPGQPGEIVHRSPQLLTGYWDKPAETEEAFTGGWFHSGDVGYFDEAGYLYVVDRLKDVINTGGIVVASREVEEALFSHPAVSEVAVVALPDPKWIEAITAIVVLRSGGHAADEAALIEHARSRLAPILKRVITQRRKRGKWRAKKIASFP